MRKLSDDLTMLTARLMMASSKGEVLKLTNEMSEIIGRLLEIESCSPTKKEQAVTGFLKFSNEEISKMPKTFKKEFRTDGCTAHITKRPSGKGTFVYEIRYRRNGYNVTASSKDLAEAKRKFIEALKTAEPIEKNAAALPVPQTFTAFAMYYFETFRRKKVKHTTMKSDMSRFNLHIKPFFKEIELKNITPKECQDLLERVEEQGKGKTSDEVYSILNQIFKSAISHGLISRNPLDIVLHIQHNKEHGTGLSHDEEYTLLSKSAGTPYQILFAVCLFAGLRPNELPSVKIEGGFIIAVNSKRKHRRVEHKKIPVIPALRSYLVGINVPPKISYEMLRIRFKKILPDHKLYDLRTTFYTRCKEYGVADAARDEFVGHSLGAMGNAYTDLSDEYLLKEAEKLAAWGIAAQNVPQNVPQNQE